MKSSVGNAGFFASLVQGTGKNAKAKKGGKSGVAALFGASFLKVTTQKMQGIPKVADGKSKLTISSDILKKLIKTADKAEVKEALKEIAQEMEKLGDSLDIGKDIKKQIEKLISSDEEIDEEVLQEVLFGFVEVLSTLTELQKIITDGGLDTISLESGEEVSLTEMATMLDEVTQNVEKSLKKAGVSPTLLQLATGKSTNAVQSSETVTLTEAEVKLVQDVLQKKGGSSQRTQQVLELAQQEGRAETGFIADETSKELPALVTSILSKLKGSVSKVKKVVAKTTEKGQKLEALGALKGEESLEKVLSEKEIAVRSKSSKSKSEQLVKQSIHTGLKAGTGEKSKLAELLNFSTEFSQNLTDGDELLQSVSEKVSQAGKVGGHKQLHFSSLAERLFESQIMQQVTSRVSDAVKDGLHVINIKLRPEHLGDVSIKLQVEGDVVTAKINVENQQVKQIIENNFQNLRDSLEEQNLYAGSLDVNVGGDEGADFNEYAEEFGFESNGSYGDEISEDELLVEEGVGIDTGRRFGTNSFEYSA